MGDNRVCLVTGGAGFIGRAIANGLLDRFARVVVIDSLHPQIHPERKRPDALPAAVELIVGDVTDNAVESTSRRRHADDNRSPGRGREGIGVSLRWSPASKMRVSNCAAPRDQMSSPIAVWPPFRQSQPQRGIQIDEETRSKRFPGRTDK